jgi:hypothetical protein
MEFIMSVVLIKKVVEATGYTEQAIRAKIKRGVWLEGQIWNKAPDNRIVFYLEEIQSWMSGKKA